MTGYSGFNVTVLVDFIIFCSEKCQIFKEYATKKKVCFKVNKNYKTWARLKSFFLTALPARVLSIGILSYCLFDGATPPSKYFCN